MASIFKQYISKIGADLRHGIATEHTYRPALKILLEQVGGDGVLATNEPKRTSVGAPDFDLSTRTPHGLLRIGHLEAKDIGVSLDEFEKSEQFSRYKALPNLITTDHLEFRWYHNGVSVLPPARLATVDERGTLQSAQHAAEDVKRLLAAFFLHRPESIRSPQVLAERLALYSHLIRDLIANAFAVGSASPNLQGLREVFEKVLLPGLSPADFADMYAQTLAYGLFAARVNHTTHERFIRDHAGREIPKTNPFLRRLFGFVTGADFEEEPFAGLVDDLAQLLADTDMQSILENFGHRKPGEDPVVHFYETFLAAYDPRLRELRGVYYTPLPVVGCIVRSVDALLRNVFDLPQGLVDSGPPARRLLILDPALGTGTFLYAVIDHIREEFRRRKNAGKWSSYVREELLPRLFGFELLMAPYAVAHLKLGMQLAALDLASEERTDWAYDFASAERLGVYLTNSLEEALEKSRVLIGEFISDEANAAAAIKRARPIMVVLGNPPYSGHSANKGPWITELVADYKRDVPGLNKPAQAKWLQDDYVKFIRFGQWRINQTGEGILAFITNHGYLSNPTFRGMRQRLVEEFTDIYVLDLHGSSKRGERAPKGGADENVFDIQQGVAIGMFVKKRDHKGAARVHHADCYGRRAEKYEWLDNNSVETVKWTAIEPTPPLYLFVPRDASLVEEYERGWRLPEIFNHSGDPAPGIVTTQDQFAISFTEDEAREKVDRFLQTTTEDEAREMWRLCSQSQWNYERAKEQLASGEWRTKVEPLLYRPFDFRYTIFDANVAVHLRKRVMLHMLGGKNLGLAGSRTVEISRGFEHVLCTRNLIQHHSVSMKEVNYLFPLYVYKTVVALGRDQEDVARQPNISSEVVREIETRFGLHFLEDGGGDLKSTVGPEDVFRYVYAILHAPGYRRRYDQLLRSDFPRIPLTDDLDVFRALVAKGNHLVELHLLESQDVRKGLTNYPVPGPNVVDAGHPRYIGPGAADPITGTPLTKGRLYISKDVEREKRRRGQYFEGVEPEVWDFHIGGHRVLEKWLKDRRGRELRVHDIEHIERVIASIHGTVMTVTEIDTIVEWPLT